jgi:hypothetical protein
MMAVALLVDSCNQSANKGGENLAGKEKIVSATVEELLANPSEYEGLQVAISGKVTHVCRHGGHNCFVLSEDGETQIRIVPGGDIDEFKIDLEGSTVAFKGVLKVLSPGQAEADTEECSSEAGKAEVYIEAVDFREITE